MSLGSTQTRVSQATLLHLAQNKLSLTTFGMRSWFSSDDGLWPPGDRTKNQLTETGLYPLYFQHLFLGGGGGEAGFLRVAVLEPTL